MTDRGITNPDFEEIAKKHPPNDGETHITEIYRDPTIQALEQRIQNGTGGIVHRFSYPEDMDPPDKFQEKGFHQGSPVSLSSDVDELSSQEPKDIFEESSELTEGCLLAIKEATNIFGFDNSFTTEDLREESTKVKQNANHGTTTDYLTRMSKEDNGRLLVKEQESGENVYKVNRPWYKQ